MDLVDSLEIKRNAQRRLLNSGQYPPVFLHFLQTAQSGLPVPQPRTYI